MVENCVRHIAHGDHDGRSKREGIRNAAVEVRKPTLFGELIIAIVDLPILALGCLPLAEREGDYFLPNALLPANSSSHPSCALSWIAVL